MGFAFVYHSSHLTMNAQIEVHAHMYVLSAHIYENCRYCIARISGCRDLSTPTTYTPKCSFETLIYICLFPLSTPDKAVGNECDSKL